MRTGLPTKPFTLLYDGATVVLIGGIVLVLVTAFVIGVVVGRVW